MPFKETPLSHLLVVLVMVLWDLRLQCQFLTSRLAQVGFLIPNSKLASGIPTFPLVS